MQNKTVEILLAPEATVKYGERKILIRECDSLALLNFVELLVTKVSDVITYDAKGKIVVDIAKIIQAVKNTRELINVIIEAATDLKPEDALKLPPRVLTRIIDLALELNITEEFLEAGKAVANRIKALMPAEAKTPSAPSSKR